ncbi:hypothetical protein [Microbulbifer sp. JMSA003]|uniref:hypothetical protein n=1 Tax=unclassified Microbulbifer TaxID=2619833 RepID=UPI0040393C4E
MRTLLFTIGLALSIIAHAGEHFSGIVEEEIVFDTIDIDKSEYFFSIKDESSGSYYLINSGQARNKGVGIGDRVTFYGTAKGNRIDNIESVKVLKKHDRDDL